MGLTEVGRLIFNHCATFYIKYPAHLLNIKVILKTLIASVPQNHNHFSLKVDVISSIPFSHEKKNVYIFSMTPNYWGICCLF